MTFGEFLWAMVIFFFWVTDIWMFIAIFGDIFRRTDIHGGAKALWVLLIFVLPVVGVLAYIFTRPKMTAQDQAMMESMQSQPAMTGHSAADEIAKAQQLKNSGAITAEEFEAMKAKAMMM